MHETDKGLKNLTALVKKQIEVAKGIEDMKRLLKMQEKALADIKEKEIPQLMEELGLTSFKTLDGASVELKRSIFASIPKDRQGEAFDWFITHDMDYMLKTSCGFTFGKEDAKIKEAFLRMIHDSPYSKILDVRESVHPSTLKAFVKRSLSEGVDLPLDLFGVFEKLEAKIT